MRRLLRGAIAGSTGVFIIYLIALALATDSRTKTGRALRDAYKPGVTNLIYAQTMAESLAAAEGPAGGPVQTRVLALAEALNEREEFSAALAADEIEGIGMALEDACLERRILAVSFLFITGTPKPKPSCPEMATEKDFEKLDPERLAARRTVSEPLVADSRGESICSI